MTANEFNEKYKDYLKPRFYGMGINDLNVISYFDKTVFPKLIEKYGKDFEYYQIKLKFDNVCFYCSAKNVETRRFEERANIILSHGWYCKNIKKFGESCTLNNDCKYPNCDEI